MEKIKIDLNNHEFIKQIKINEFKKLCLNMETIDLFTLYDNFTLLYKKDNWNSIEVNKFYKLKNIINNVIKFRDNFKG